MKRLALLLVLLLALSGCGGAQDAGQSAAEAADTPQETQLPQLPAETQPPETEQAEEIPEPCRAYYGYPELEPIVPQGLELPPAADAERGAPDYLSLWYQGSFSQIKTPFSDEGYTMEELTGGKGSEMKDYGRFCWNGESYDCIHVRAEDSFIPNLGSVEGGVLWLELSGDCRGDDGTAEGAHFEGFDTVIISGSGTLTLEQGINCGLGERPFPALIVDGVELHCPTVTLKGSPQPESGAALALLSGSVTTDVLSVSGDVCTAGGELRAGLLVDCGRLVCRGGSTVISEGWGSTEEGAGLQPAVILSGGSLTAESWLDERTEYELWEGDISAPGLKVLPGVHILSDRVTVLDTGA